MGPHVALPQAEFKVVLLGDTNTGKTSLALRFVEGYYRDDATSSTVGAFFLTKRLHLQQQTTSCKLLLWDTAGQPHYRRLAKTYYQQAAAAIFTYDVSQPQSLHRLRMILEEVEQNTQDKRIVYAIAACKTDLDPSLHHPGIQEEAAKLAAEYNALYIPTSAKTNDGVQSLFEQTAERVWQWYREANAGMGLPISVVVGGTISSKTAQQHLRIRSMDRPPLIPSPTNLMPRSATSPRIFTPPFDLYDHTPDNQLTDTSNDDSADDVLDGESVQTSDASSNAFMCDGNLLSCTEDPTKGCIIL